MYITCSVCKICYNVFLLENDAYGELSGSVKMYLKRKKYSKLL